VYRIEGTGKNEPRSSQGPLEKMLGRIKHKITVGMSCWYTKLLGGSQLQPPGPPGIVIPLLVSQRREKKKNY